MLKWISRAANKGVHKNKQDRQMSQRDFMSLKFH